MGSNLIERATPNLLFFYLPKPLNEEEDWIRPWLRTIFFKPHFCLKGNKELNYFHLIPIYRELSALQEPTQGIS